MILKSKVLLNYMDILDTTQQWQDNVLESILDFVKGRDGDFNVIGRLSKAVSDDASFQVTLEFVSKYPQGKGAIEKRIRLGDVDLQKLHQLPKDTFGYAYANHMIENNLNPIQAGEVNNDYQYLAAHIAETHDIWHVVTGCNTDILGEIKLEAFYVSQLYATRFWLALITKNLLRAVVYDVEVSHKYMDALTEGWLMAKQAKPLFGMEWNQLWETSLEDVRNSLNIVPS